MIHEYLNILRIAGKALERNKVRSALTALGVIIGVASVIAMIALGSGARAAIDEQVQSTGTNVIYVSAGSFQRMGSVRGGIGSVQTLTLEDAWAIRDQVPSVLRLEHFGRGGRRRHILRQFLTEAVSLSVLGGIAGILLEVGISRLLSGVLGWPTLVTSSSIAIAFAFAAAVGIFFGYYPARKAATLDPIDALRYE